MSIATELISGGVAGAAGILATQPLDTIRIRLQSLQRDSSLRYSGILSCATSALRSEGIRGLYKGVASPTLTVGIMNAVVFCAYDMSSSAIQRASGIKEADDLSLAQVWLAGASAGFASAFITAPTELVKCHAQLNLKNKGLMYEEWVILRNMVRDHGLFGTYGPCRGLGITIVRETPSFGLYFTTYEAICRKYGKSGTVSFYAGGFAGAFAWASIYPIDVIKTRWSTAAPNTYNSIRHCLQTCVAQDGRGVLFQGFAATMIRAWPQNAVIFYTYEWLKKVLTNESE